MRLTSALEQLRGEIADMKRLESLAGSVVIARWDNLVGQIYAAAQEEWMPEPQFRARTGASGKWCRRNYAALRLEGLARPHGKRREWHVSARPPKAPPASNRDDVVARIATSYLARAA